MVLFRKDKKLMEVEESKHALRKSLSRASARFISGKLATAFSQSSTAIKCKGIRGKGVKQIEKKDNRIVQWLIQKAAKKPGVSLIIVALTSVVLLPLIVHYILMTIYVLLKLSGLLVTADEISWSMFVSKGQLENVGFMLAITAVLILIWYKGMNNIYSKYFRSHRPFSPFKLLIRDRERKTD